MIMCLPTTHRYYCEAMWQLRTLRRYRAREVAIIVLWAGREDTEGSAKPRAARTKPAS